MSPVDCYNCLPKLRLEWRLHTKVNRVHIRQRLTYVFNTLPTLNKAYIFELKVGVKRNIARKLSYSTSFNSSITAKLIVCTVLSVVVTTGLRNTRAHESRILVS
jgi:hypothetical protein